MNLQDTINVIPDPFTTGVLNIALPHAPMIDGSLITGQVLNLVSAGAVNPSIPIIIGSNADESRTTMTRKYPLTTAVRSDLCARVPGFDI